MFGHFKAILEHTSRAFEGSGGHRAVPVVLQAGSLESWAEDRLLCLLLEEEEEEDLLWFLLSLLCLLRPPPVFPSLSRWRDRQNLGLKQQEATSRDGLMRDATTIRILSCSSLPRSPRNCPSWAPGQPCQGACDRR